jgi:methylamine dehydrogenase accessory protein MauD
MSKLERFALWGVWGTVVVLVVVMIAIVRQLGFLLGAVRLQGARVGDESLEVGTELGTLSASTLTGDSIEIGLIEAPQDLQLLLSISPGCSSCSALMPGFKRLERLSRPRYRTALVALAGDPEQIDKYVTEYRLQRIPVIHDRALVERLELAVAPYAIVISTRDGRILARGTVNTVAQIEGLQLAAEAKLGSTSEELEEDSHELVES